MQTPISDNSALNSPALDPERYEALSRSAERFGRSLSGALAGGIAHGRSFDQILQSVGARLIDIGLRAAFKPLENALSSALGSLMSSLGGGGNITPIRNANGGVLNAPTWFPLAGGTGLAGEAGPEAILPLARGPDGKLGVRAGAGGEGGRAVQVTVNIAAQDADSFRRSEAQLSAAIARAVARGQRAM